MKFILKKTVDLFSSYGMACVILLFLLLLTFLGTVEQVNSGLFQVQKKYFESIFLTHEVYGVPIPLPGVYLLLALLSVNLLLGGIIRLRKNKRTVGVFIIHLGIVVLMVGGLIQYYMSTRGNMRLFPEESASHYVSYYEWEISVSKAGENTEYIIPGKQFDSLQPGQSQVFVSDELPFDLIIDRYMMNANVAPKGPMFEVDEPVVDGFFLQEMKPELAAERNIAGAYVTVREKDAGESVEKQGILWGLSAAPWAVQAGGETWAIDLRKAQYPVPFTIRLDKFTRELHPGTRIASVFHSEVTKIEDGAEQKVHIQMNEPLRHKGYTFFQASWGPENAGPNDRLFSVFEVVKNPADKFPLYACIIITIGLVWQFSQKLFTYLRRESRRHA